jgi:hypothetical protein
VDDEEGLCEIAGKLMGIAEQLSDSGSILSLGSVHQSGMSL